MRAKTATATTIAITTTANHACFGKYQLADYAIRLMNQFFRLFFYTGTIGIHFLYMVQILVIAHCFRNVLLAIYEF